MINTLYLAIIIKTYIPFSSGPIKSEDHILPAQCRNWDSWVPLRSDLNVFNDRPPLISWWRKNAATAEKDDHPWPRMVFASGHSQSVIHIRPYSHCKNSFQSWLRSYLTRWETPEAIMNPYPGPPISSEYQLRVAFGLQRGLQGQQLLLSSLPNALNPELICCFLHEALCENANVWII